MSRFIPALVLMFSLCVWDSCVWVMLLVFLFCSVCMLLFCPTLLCSFLLLPSTHLFPVILKLGYHQVLVHILHQSVFLPHGAFCSPHATLVLVPPHTWMLWCLYSFKLKFSFVFEIPVSVSIPGWKTSVQLCHRLLFGDDSQLIPHHIFQPFSLLGWH